MCLKNYNMTIYDHFTTVRRPSHDLHRTFTQPSHNLLTTFTWPFTQSPHDLHTTFYTTHTQPPHNLRTTFIRPTYNIYTTSQNIHTTSTLPPHNIHKTTTQPPHDHDTTSTRPLKDLHSAWFSAPLCPASFNDAVKRILSNSPSLSARDGRKISPPPHNLTPRGLGRRTLQYLATFYIPKQWPFYVFFTFFPPCHPFFCRYGTYVGWYFKNNQKFKKI